MKRPVPLLHRLLVSPAVRIPAFLCANTLGRPLLWSLQQTPAAVPLFNLLGSRIELTRIRGNSFGDYRPAAHDVIVCSYGKSGTNWALQMTHQIAHRGRGHFEHIHGVVPWPDELGRGFSIALEDPAPRAQSPTGMRVIKTHLPWHCIPYAPEAKYIAIVRDPKDVAVSGYHFFRSVLLGPLMPRPDIWVEHFLTGKSLLGSWAEHLAGFWAQRHRENVLFLTYEEMKRDTPAAVDRIAHLMGVSLADHERAAVLLKCSFEHMRSIDHKFYPGLVSPLGLREGKMMREGKSRNAGTLLSPTMLRRIDDCCRNELLRLGCDFPYDSTYAHNTASA